MGLQLTWKQHLLGQGWTGTGCCWWCVGEAGPLYRSVIGQRAGSGLSVFGFWPRCGWHCKTLEFPGSSC